MVFENNDFSGVPVIVAVIPQKPKRYRSHLTAILFVTCLRNPQKLFLLVSRVVALLNYHVAPCGKVTAENATSVQRGKLRHTTLRKTRITAGLL